MSLESLLYDTLKGLVANRVYPDIAPEGVVALPRITFQQAGGRAVNYVEPVPAGVHNARMQVNVWGATRLQVSALSKQVSSALKSEPALHTSILGGPVAVYESDTKLYGSRQDFSLWA